MGNNESSPAPNGKPTAFESLPVETKASWVKAKNCLQYGRIDEAISEYSALMAQINANSLLFSSLAIHRADAYIQDSQYDAARQDLQLARDELALLNGDTSEELLLSLDAVFSRLPVKSEETIELVPEPSAQAVEETSQSRELGLGRTALGPAIQDA